MQTSLIPRTLHPVPDFIPARVRDSIAGKVVSMKRIPQQIRRRMRTSERLSGAEWAARYRNVTDGAHEGQWRHEYAPHTVKIMDTYTKAHVREVWFCGVEQSGKTNTILNCMGWAIDCDPGNIFYLMPTEDTAKKIIGGKVRPMLRRSPRLARYLSSRADDLSLDKISLSHGVTIFPAHANSPASMATWSAKHCFGDEIDKNPLLSGPEADSITLIRKRGRMYKGRYKRFFASTPAGRFIYEGTWKCQQVWIMELCCPHCYSYVRLDAEHLHLPEGIKADDLQPGQASYTCNACGALWDEIDRERAIRRGRWYCDKGINLNRPHTVGFHHRAWECLDISLHEIAGAWLKQLNGNRGDKIAWANGYEATNYLEDHKDRQEDQILTLVDLDLPRGLVPPDISCLILLADTQQVGFFFQIWAYGWGRDLETWRIDHGFVEHFQHLADLTAREYMDADGRRHRIAAAFIDSGGGSDPQRPKHTRTAQVYEFCRQNPLFKPLKGRREQDEPWTVKRLDYYPTRGGQKVPIPGGLNLYKINVTHYKNEMAVKLMISPDSPGAWHLHAETGEEYARQMCAEYKDDHNRYWLCPQGKANHHWDIGVYGLAAADILGIKASRRPEDRTQTEGRAKQPKKPASRW